MQEIFPSFLKPYAPMIQGVITAIAIFVVGWMASKVAASLIVRGFRRAKMDDALARFLGSLARYTILAATIIAALGSVGVQTTSLVAIFASAGLAVGLALQGSLANFASGVLILIFRPFSLGDVVTVAGHTGTVDDIGIFTTTLVTITNEVLIIPNGKITSDTIMNVTTRGKRCGIVDVRVHSEFEIAKVQEALLRAAASAEKALQEPSPTVTISAIGDGFLVYSLAVWGASKEYLSMLNHVRRCVNEEIKAAGIPGPVNQIVIQKKN
jgi:small conductance mechanosensitive channel